MNNTSYLFASCKPWHKSRFEALQADGDSIWQWVSTPEELIDAAKALEPRYIFFFHWNWLVPSDIYSRYECVCFHMTDVPYGRGGSPLQNLIKAGHNSTKLTALRMVKEMDAGPVYAKRDMSLDGKAEDIYLRAGELSTDIAKWMIKTQPDPLPQSGDVTLFKRRKPEQSELPTEGTLTSIYDHIRMLDAPTYPYAFIEHGSLRLTFHDATIVDGELYAKVKITLPTLKRNDP
ncbi:hypothetical protein ACIKP7_20870 [Pseudomonas caricapapayae]|uniref:Uncharacterized protein n=1 Tax=Pseudomonas caricapapayae TaxID=46678 RepID=A0ACC7M1F4_9PSED